MGNQWIVMVSKLSWFHYFSLDACWFLGSFSSLTYVMLFDHVLICAPKQAVSKYWLEHEQNLESYLTVRSGVCRIDKSTCRLQPTNKISPTKCFLNHFNLISYFISFALCDWNTFSFFKWILAVEIFSFFFFRKSYNDRSVYFQFFHSTTMPMLWFNDRSNDARFFSHELWKRATLDVLLLRSKNNQWRF